MSVSISVFSDLHLEFGELDLTHIDSDVVILAGDIFIKNRSIPWIQSQFGDKDVILIDGNHEFYGSNIASIKRKTREAVAGTNIHYLDDSYIDLYGVRFVGSTLWTDFNLYGNPTVAKNMAVSLVEDYKTIRIPIKGNYQRLHPSNTLSMHLQSREFIAKTITESPLPTVVVTHHAPSLKSIDPRFKNDHFSPNYASNMDDFIVSHPSALWVHGHTHYNVDYKIGETRIITNQRGYIGHEIAPDFNPDHKIILDV